MRKKILSLLLAFVMAAALLPMSAAALSQDKLRDAVTKEYDSFAASIAQEEAHNLAVSQLLQHSLQHPNQMLTMDETDGFTAAMFGSVLFRNYMLDALTAGVEFMERENTDRVLLGGTNLAWHDFAYHYRLIQWDDYDMENPILDNCSRMLTENVYYTGTLNQNDSAMTLVVGNAESYLRIREIASDPIRTTYHAELTVYDRFDFDTDYSDEEAFGFDTSTSVLISMLGSKYLNPFDWRVDVSFDFTVSALPFTDVSGSDWFAAPVLWAVENQVTSGKTETAFAPNDGCTRAQVVTFLWAANGRPEPTAAENPFADVSKDDWYYHAVLWAVEQGITTGVTATEFAPKQTCTRAQIATFLWAAQGKPSPHSLGGFGDVAIDDWFAAPVIWAKENGITGGIGDGKFGPYDTCTRAQVVTFLKKVYG